MATKKITDFTEKTTINDSDLMLAGDNGTASLRKISWYNILESIKHKISNWAFTGLNTTNKTLINAVNEVNDNKISRSDIVDNLLSDAANLPVSANQAKLLNEMINKTTGVQDLHDLVKIGGVKILPETITNDNIDKPIGKLAKWATQKYMASASLSGFGTYNTMGLLLGSEYMDSDTASSNVSGSQVFIACGSKPNVYIRYKQDYVWNSWRTVGGCTLGQGPQGFTLKSGTGNNSFLRQDRDTGRVELHLELTGINTDYTSVNTTFAVIPEGYRPDRTIDVVATCYESSQNAYIPVIIRINTNGDVYQVHSSGFKLTDIYANAFWYTKFNNFEVL